MDGESWPKWGQTAGRSVLYFAGSGGPRVGRPFKPIAWQNAHLTTTKISLYIASSPPTPLSWTHLCHIPTSPICLFTQITYTFYAFLLEKINFDPDLTFTWSCASCFMGQLLHLSRRCMGSKPITFFENINFEHFSNNCDVLTILTSLIH